MSVPWVKGALRGWTKKKSATFVTKSVVNHQVVEAITKMTIRCNLQPVPPETIQRKPQEQWTWKWWSIIVSDGPLLKNNDKITIDGIAYRIERPANWSESGFQKYEAVEDYQ